MTTTTPNGVITLSNDRVRLAREADFNDFIRYSPPAKVHELVTALKTEVRRFGEQRSPMMDLYRARLSQLRQVIAAA